TTRRWGWGGRRHTAGPTATGRDSTPSAIRRWRLSSGGDALAKSSFTPPAVAGTHSTTSLVDNFHIDPPLLVKGPEKARRLASLGEARAYVDEALRLGRPEAWRE